MADGALLNGVESVGELFEKTRSAGAGKRTFVENVTQVLARNEFHGEIGCAGRGDAIGIDGNNVRMMDLTKGGDFLFKTVQDGSFVLHFAAKDFDGAGALLANPPRASNSPTS